MAKFRVDALCLSLSLLLVAALFTPVAAFVVGEDDYRTHLVAVDNLVRGQPFGEFVLQVPHFLFHLLVLSVYRTLAGTPLTNAAFVVALFGYLAGTVAIYGLISALIGRATSYRTGLLYATLSLSLMLVMPINLLTPHNRYLGYIIAHAYHNPTMVVLKPLALVLFYVSARFFDARPLRRPIAYTASVGVATLACALAKPSYVMALAPALVLAATHALRRGAAVHLRPLAYGVLLPIAVVVGLQMTSLSDRRGVVVAPLGVFHEWARLLNPDAATNLPLKFVLSILFPLVVYLFCLREARGSFYLNLAWLTFGFGAAYTYLLAEPGADMGFGNFTWCGQITVFVLFVASAAFLLGWATRAATPRSGRVTASLVVIAVVFALHLVSGLQWYGLHTGWLPMGYIIAVW
jgi:hypothetical protein